MVGDIKLSKQEAKKIRLLFWALWSVAITMPSSLATMLIYGVWWASPVIMIVCTVLGLNYCEWLIKRRQWKAEHTVIRCECGHTDNIHYGELGEHCQYSKHMPDGDHNCNCQGYVPSYWTMSGRV